MLPPGPRASKLMQVWRAEHEPVRFFGDCLRRYGSVFTVGFGPVGKTVMVADARLARIVFAADPERLEAGRAETILEPLFGRHSTLVLDGAEHAQRRHESDPFFSAGHVVRFGETMAAAIGDEIDSWSEGRELQLRGRMQAVTLETITRVMFGHGDENTREAIKQKLSGFADQGASAAILVPWLRLDLGPWSPWGRFQRQRRAIDALLDEEIRSRRAAGASTGDDGLALFLRATGPGGRALPDEDIRDELRSILLAGYETTATTLAWATELLLRAPAALARLQAAVAGGDETYLQAVVTETLRLRPPLFAAVRAVQAPFGIGGHVIPAGQGIGIPIPLIHWSPDNYPDPEEFRPDRFIERPPDPLTWIPFGGGTRRCLGAWLAPLTITVILRELVRRVRFEPLRDEPEPIELEAVTILIPKHGVPVRVAELRSGAAV